MKQLKIILTGASGFVGEGVLIACLEHPQIGKVLMVNRKHIAMQHPKLTECLVTDFMDLDAVKNNLSGYDACFYCAGISSAGMDERAYTHITYNVTLAFAQALIALNPDMVFNFVSGGHTDSTEKGTVMWARVKGKTENALGKLPFKSQYNFRPGFMKPTPGQKNVKVWYKVLGFIFPVLLPKHSSTMREVGLAMINTALTGYPKQTLEIKDIKIAAKA